MQILDERKRGGVGAAGEKPWVTVVRPRSCSYLGQEALPPGVGAAGPPPPPQRLAAPSGHRSTSAVGSFS